MDPPKSPPNPGNEETPKSLPPVGQKGFHADVISTPSPRNLTMPQSVSQHSTHADDDRKTSNKAPNFAEVSFGSPNKPQTSQDQLSSIFGGSNISTPSQRATPSTPTNKYLARLLEESEPDDKPYDENEVFVPTPVTKFKYEGVTLVPGQLGNLLPYGELWKCLAPLSGFGEPEARLTEIQGTEMASPDHSQNSLIEPSHQPSYRSDNRIVSIHQQSGSQQELQSNQSAYGDSAVGGLTSPERIFSKKQVPVIERQSDTFAARAEREGVRPWSRGLSDDRWILRPEEMWKMNHRPTSVSTTSPHAPCSEEEIAKKKATMEATSASQRLHDQSSPQWAISLPEANLAASDESSPTKAKDTTKQPDALMGYAQLTGPNHMESDSHETQRVAPVPEEFQRLLETVRRLKGSSNELPTNLPFETGPLREYLWRCVFDSSLGPASLNSAEARYTTTIDGHTVTYASLRHETLSIIEGMVRGMASDRNTSTRNSGNVGTWSEPNNQLLAEDLRQRANTEFQDSDARAVSRYYVSQAPGQRLNIRPKQMPTNERPHTPDMQSTDRNHPGAIEASLYNDSTAADTFQVGPLQRRITEVSDNSESPLGAAMGGHQPNPSSFGGSPFQGRRISDTSSQATLQYSAIEEENGKNDPNSRTTPSTHHTSFSTSANFAPGGASACPPLYGHGTAPFQQPYGTPIMNQGGYQLSQVGFQQRAMSDPPRLNMHAEPFYPSHAGYVAVPNYELALHPQYPNGFGPAYGQPMGPLPSMQRPANMQPPAAFQSPYSSTQTSPAAAGQHLEGHSTMLRSSARPNHPVARPPAGRVANTSLLQNVQWANRLGGSPAPSHSPSKYTSQQPAMPTLQYRPGSDDMFPRNVGGTSVKLQELTRKGPPDMHGATSEENSPFAETARERQPANWGVMKVGNIPYSIGKQDVLAFLGRNAKILSPAHGVPVHIIMDRATGKTMDCYVEFFSKADVQVTINKFKNRPSRPRMHERIVDIEMSSQEELMKELFPKAKNVEWKGQVPMVTQSDEPFNSGFKGFVTGEELVLLVKHAGFPHRSTYTQKCLSRPYESQTSTLAKWPWFAVDYYTIAQRDQLFATTRDLLRLLVGQLKRGGMLGLTQMLLTDLLMAALNAPGFSEKQRWELREASDFAGQRVRISPLAQVWPFEVLCRKAGFDDDVIRYYAEIFTNSAGTEASDSPFGRIAFSPQFQVQKGMTLAAAGDLERMQFKALLSDVLT